MDRGTVAFSARGSQAQESDCRTNGTFCSGIRPAVVLPAVSECCEGRKPRNQEGFFAPAVCRTLIVGQVDLLLARTERGLPLDFRSVRNLFLALHALLASGGHS